MQEFIACPYCGKKLPVGQTTCPHCGSDLPAGSHNGPVPMKHSQWDSIHRKEKNQRIAMALLIGSISLTMLFYMAYVCGFSAILGLQLGVRYRAWKLESLTREPAAVLEYPAFTQEERDGILGQDLCWHPAEIRDAHPELTEEEYHALEMLCIGELRTGTSRKECLETLQQDVDPETARQLLDYCQADFNTQALSSARREMEHGAFTPAGLMKELEGQGFTLEQVQYALDHCGADWQQQTALAAQEYLRQQAISETALKERLLQDGHDPQAIRQALVALDPDWNREALQRALEWDSPTYMIKTEEDLMGELAYRNFTSDQVRYAADKMNLH